MKGKLILAALFCNIIISNAQPQGNETFIKLELVLLDCKKDTILFDIIDNNDKLIKSFNDEYAIDFYESKKNSEPVNVNNRIVFLNPKYKNKLLEIGYISFVNVANLSNEDTSTDLIVIIQKKQKNMKIIYKVYKQFKQYQPWVIKMAIPFQKGVFEIRDPENPKLIAIKE